MNKLVVYFFILMFTGLFTTVAQAQNVEFTESNFPGKSSEVKQAIKNIKEGDLFFDQGKWLYVRAIELYLKAYELNPNNAMLNYKIGKCYISSINKINSIQYLEKALALDAKAVPSETPYLLAQAYHLNYEFVKAIKGFKEYQSAVSSDPVASTEVSKKLKEVVTAVQLVKDTVRLNEDGDTVKIIVKNLGSALNGKFPEYNPIVNADESEMFFTSQREGSTGGIISPEDYNFFEDIYVTTRGESDWSTPTNPGKPINGIYNDAIVGLSPDGQKLFTYKGDNGGDIYMSVLEGSVWSKPEKLNDNINTKFKESSASFSYDGRTLYFVSNREGGQGGNDIYISKADASGQWGKAENIGATINTQYDESGVFMHPDGKTLYFSSKGHNTMGGLDIFKSIYENGKWSVPENIGYPVNTTDDDAFFSMAANGQHGYLSSVRKEGAGSHDIYMVTFKARPPQLALLKGTILNDKTLKPVEATIEIIDNVTREVISTFKSNSATGKYLISLPSGHNYGITVKADNYLFHSENLDLPKSYNYTEVVKDVKLKSIAVGSKIVLNNIFFDFGKATLRKESEAELDKLTKLLNDIPTLRIEIAGHTDNKSSADFNQKLSEARAKSVVDYLIAQGINASRLRYKGYGLTRPIADNNTEQGRQLNRRTEFEVLGK